MGDLTDGLCSLLASITASITDISDEDVAMALNCLVANQYLEALFPDYDISMMKNIYQHLDKQKNTNQLKATIQQYETQKNTFTNILKLTKCYIEASVEYETQPKEIKRALHTHTKIRTKGTKLILGKDDTKLEVKLSQSEIQALSTLHLCIHYLDPFLYKPNNTLDVDETTILSQLESRCNQVQILTLAKTMKRRILAILHPNTLKIKF